MNGEYIDAILENGMADAIFGIILLAMVGSLLMVILFGGLAVLSLWDWLSYRSYKSVIVAIERKAFRG